MSRVCTVCAHVARPRIDRDLASSAIIREIAAKYHLSEDALSRHKAHLAGAVVRAAERREISIGGTVMGRLEKLYQRAEKVLSDAEASGDGRLALAGVREIRETLSGMFALVLKGAESAGLAPFATGDLKSELARRGELAEVVVLTRVLGDRPAPSDPQTLDITPGEP